MVLTLPAACAAGNYAIGFACDMIRAGKADVVVTGRVTDASVVVATVRALKMHGGVAKEDLGKENVEELAGTFGSDTLLMPCDVTKDEVLGMIIMGKKPPQAY